MALAISSDARRLKKDSAPLTGPPPRRGVERIAFGELFDAALAGELDANVGGAVLVQDAEHHIAGLAGDRDMADAGAVVVPQAALLSAKRFDLEQSAEAAAFQ